MAIRCSIVGCEYDDTHIEREEERRGEEVVLTVREFKECRRCGNTELISENTGVTSIARPEHDEEPTEDGSDATGEATDDPDGSVQEGTETPEQASEVDPATVVEEAEPGADTGTTDDAVVLGSDGDAEPATAGPAGTDPVATDSTADPGTTDQWPGEESTAAPTEGAPADADSAGETVTDDAVFIDGTDDRTGGLDEAAAMEDEPTITGSDAEEEYPEDDAVILDGSGSAEEGAGVGLGGDDWPDAGETTAGGWPDHDDHGGPGRGSNADASGWPDAEGDDEGWDARAGDAGGDEEAVAFDGLAPGERGGTAGMTKNRSLSGESEAVEAGTEPDAGGDSATGDPVGPAGEAAGSSATLFCSGCGHAVDRGATAHRAGDICPDCSREYLAER